MTNQSYVAHESFWTDFRMALSMLHKALLVGLLLQIILFATTVSQMDMTAYIKDSKQKLPPRIALKYHSNVFGLFNNYEWRVDNQLLPYSKGWAKLPAKIYNEMADYATGNTYQEQHDYIVTVFKISFLGYLGSFAYLGIFIYLAKRRKSEEYIRGAQMIGIQSLNQRLAEEAKENELSQIKIGDTIFPFEMESKHILILGTSGSGKGVLMNQIISQINQRKETHKTGERCIFYDLKGEFVSKQYQPGDIIFSPFDKRSQVWNIFNEIECEPDFDVLAKSLFVSTDAKNEYWYNCAGDVFRTGLVYLKAKRTTTNRDIWNFFAQDIPAIISAFRKLEIKERGALQHLNKADSSTSASIISIVRERIHFFRYLIDMDGPFSFRDFIRQQDSTDVHPNLFILNIDKYDMIFKPLMTLCIDSLIRETLSLPDKLDRRIWFVIDELGTLYRMDSIIKLETVGRSKGGCLICSNQDLGRVEEMYGRANLKSFFNNFNTNFTFRIIEPDTAEFLSRAIGDQQLLKTTQSRQMSPTNFGDRRSETDQEKVERLIMGVEFTKLKNLEAVLSIAGYEVTRINVPPIFSKEIHPNFIMRNFDTVKYLDSTTQTDDDQEETIPLPEQPDLNKRKYDISM